MSSLGGHLEDHYKSLTVAVLGNYPKPVQTKYWISLRDIRGIIFGLENWKKEYPAMLLDIFTIVNIMHFSSINCYKEKFQMMLIKIQRYKTSQMNKKAAEKKRYIIQITKTKQLQEASDTFG